MFVELLLSLFGTALVHLNLSLVEKPNLFVVIKLRVLYVFLQLPFCFFMFFKEPISLLIIYIGIFLTTLILHDKIIAYFDQKTFERLHLHIIDRLILLISAGKSSATSVKTVWSELNEREKRIFFQLQDAFDVQNASNFEKNKETQPYFSELQTILSASAKVLEQLRSFRDILRVQHSLKQSSRQVLQQTRAQAGVACVIYLFFCVLSVRFLSLSPMSASFWVSCGLFIGGQLWIFRLGKGIKWRT